MFARASLFLRRCVDREPMVVVACFLGLTGVSFAMFAPKIRRRLGYDTSQWYGVDQEKVAIERLQTAQFVRGARGHAPTLTRE